MSSTNINNKTDRKKKRKFSIGKIASAIHCEYLISSLRYKNKDPLMLKTKLSEIKKNKTTNKTKSYLRDDQMYSPEKMYVHEFIKRNHEKQNTDTLYSSNMKTEGNVTETSKKNLMFLPLLTNSMKRINTNNEINNTPINKGKIIVNSFSDKCVEKTAKVDEKKFLATSGMFKMNNIKNPINKKTINSFLNIKTEYREKRNSIKKLNNSNTNLNIKLSKNNPKLQIKLNSVRIKDSPTKKYMTKLGLMTYLFKKYTSPTMGYTEYINNKNSKNNKINKKEEKEIYNKVVLDNKNKKNKVFLTKFKNFKNNKNYEINYVCSTTNNITRKKKEVLFNNLNKDVIEKDKKVSIDCLVASQKDINTHKLLYNNLGKTVYNMASEPSYNRIKNVERKIYDIMKDSK